MYIISMKQSILGRKSTAFGMDFLLFIQETMKQLWI